MISQQQQQQDHPYSLQAHRHHHQAHHQHNQQHQQNQHHQQQQQQQQNQQQHQQQHQQNQHQHQNQNHHHQQHKQHKQQHQHQQQHHQHQQHQHHQQNQQQHQQNQHQHQQNQHQNQNHHHQQHHQQQHQHAVTVPVFHGVDPNYPGLIRIHHDPPLYKVDNFLTQKECTHLVDIASDCFSPAPVVGVGAGGVVDNETRTSSTCYLARDDLPFLVRKVSALLATNTNTNHLTNHLTNNHNRKHNQHKPICHMELPQVGRYLTNERYLPHFDAFNVDEIDGARFASNGGQRTVTVLIYLNTVDSGGHTAFPQLLSQSQQQQQQQQQSSTSTSTSTSQTSGAHGQQQQQQQHEQKQQLEVKPVRGTALVFFPATVDGHLDPRTLHAALPAVDTKFVSQIWIRQGN